jgi:AmiR/NasT family two-component response regulator
MNRSLRIAVADDERDMRDFYERILPRMGHQVVAAVASGDELVRACHAARPELIIVDIKMPEMDGIDAAREVCREEPIPVILVTAYHDAELVERAAEEHVLAYLVKPIDEKDLEPAIALAMRRFEQFNALRQEATNLRQALEDRKLIERAKGILMRKAGLDEQAAFRRLQKLSSSRNQKLIDVARMILAAAEAFEPREETE